MHDRFGIAVLGTGATAPEGIWPTPSPATLPDTPALVTRQLHRRSIRVACLTVGVVLMSLADLWITMVYLRSVGMGEGNPIARYVMQHGSPAALVAWKCASISLAALVFLRYRERKLTEVASWFCCAVLVWLLLRWIGYADEAWSLTSTLHILPETDSSMWVRMGE